MEFYETFIRNFRKFFMKFMSFSKFLLNFLIFFQGIYELFLIFTLIFFQKISPPLRIFLQEHIFDCSHSDLGDADCTLTECVHVFCRAGGPRTGASPLLHGNTGILSILHEGEVRNVCGHEWTDVNAEIACTELYANRQVISWEAGQTCQNEQFWIDNV